MIKLKNNIRILILAIKYWLQGDEWAEAAEYARAIVKGLRGRRKN